MRSPLVWIGGKGHIVKRISAHVPPGGAPYCEPFAGGASLFWAREPATVEVLNDIDENLVNFYRVLQDEESFQRLRHVVNMTLYSRAEFKRAIMTLKSDERDAVKRAWAFLVSVRFSVSGVNPILGRGEGTGTWSRSIRISPRAKVWMGIADGFEMFHRRIKRVQIENMDAIACIRYYDNEDAVFYIDPPYHPDTLVAKRIYTEMFSHAQYEMLIDTLLSCKGAVTLSGYAHPVYQPLEQHGWRRIDIPVRSLASGNTRHRLKGGALSERRKCTTRIESVWINPQAMKRLEKARHGA